MFTTTWMRATIIFSFCFCAPLCLAGNPTTGYDRMDGDFIKPSKREQPKRNFNLTDEARATSSYSTTYSALSGDDRLESRTAKDRNLPGRWRQPVNTSRTVPATDEGDTKAEEEKAPSSNVETVEASDVATKEVSEPVASPVLINENQLVFCSKRLFEFHWDVDCPMLKNVKPTRLTFKEAREAHYTECTACAARLLNTPATR